MSQPFNFIIIIIIIIITTKGIVMLTKYCNCNVDEIIFFKSELIVNRILIVSIVINKICSIKNLKNNLRNKLYLLRLRWLAPVFTSF